MKKILLGSLCLCLFLVGCDSPTYNLINARHAFKDSEVSPIPQDASLFLIRKPDSSVWVVRIESMNVIPDKDAESFYCPFATMVFSPNK